MKTILLLLTIGVSVNLFSQRLYFPQVNYSDSVALSNSISSLANKVILSYNNSDKLQHWDNLFRFQIVAKEYREANASIDSIKNFYKENGYEAAAAAGIQYESYSLTKELQKIDNRPFDELYAITLSKLYSDLPEKTRSVVPDYFVADLSEFKNKLQALLQNLKNTKNDSIEMSDAQTLCRTYNSYNVLRAIKDQAEVILAEEKRKKYSILDSVLITTSDNAKLSAIIIRGTNSPKSKPVVLVYNIYADKNDRAIAKQAARHGFVGVVVNTRGKYLSPQNIEPFEHDARDAYDVIDWISRQPWCNGKIGMYGGSYLGFSQWSAVKKFHPALKTIVPQVAVGIGIDYPSLNNVYMSYMLRWIHYVSNNKLTDAVEFSNSEKWNNLYKKWYVTGKSFRSLDSLEGRPNSIFQKWLDHPSYDNFWYNMVPHNEEFSKINIPILTTTGYFDDDQRGALYYFNQHYKFNRNANHYLLIGPYDHEAGQSQAKPDLRGYKIDSVANININEYVFQWFDYILKGGVKPSILRDKINYQVMGTNKWRHTSSFSKMNTDTLTLYLTNIRTKSYYQLQSIKPLTKEFIAQEIDYTDRSDADKFDIANEPLLVDSTLTTNGSLIFISELLKDSIIINGSFLGKIRITINKRDVGLLVEVYEQQPDGKYFALSSYLTRASYAKNRSKRQLLQPGREEIIPINNSFFVSKKVSKGSRVIVKVGVFKKHNWQINYGTGKDVSDETIADGKIPLKIKWSNGSYIKLPFSNN